MNDSDYDYKCPLGEKFEINDYLTTTDDSAKRTRWITIVLVVATVIIFVGFYNSTIFSWVYHRLVNNYDSEYITTVNTLKDNPRPLLDPFFDKYDFVNFKDFVCRIGSESGVGGLSSGSARDATRPLSRYIFDKFNHKSQNLILDECRQEKFAEVPSDLLQKNVFIDLNILLKDKFLFTQETSQSFALRDETKSYLNLKNNTALPADKFTNSDLIRANRLFLEDVYQQTEKDGLYHSRDIVSIDGDDGGNILSPTEKRRMHRQYETVRAYIDNVQYIKIPFFGIAIDVNDLGVVGGFSLVIILLLFRFSLSREIKNLNISFKESFMHGKLCEFYHSLAMRQVLTVPNMEGETRNEALAIGSKVICLLPLAVMGFGIFYDWYSVYKLGIFEYRFVRHLLYIETIFLFLVGWLSLRCLERQIHVDTIWNDYWVIMKSKKSKDVLLDNGFDKSDDEKLKRIVKIRLKRETEDEGRWLFNLIKWFPPYVWFLSKEILKVFYKKKRR